MALVLRWLLAVAAAAAAVAAAIAPTAGTPSSVLTFPPEFLWGTATSAYQVEGAVRAGGRGASIWEVFEKVPGAIVNNDTAAVACDHYHKLEEDLDHLGALGVKAYRFSISWSRLFPAGEAAGKPLAAGVVFYNALIDGLLRRGITPVATLYHWDLPAALGHWATGDRDGLVSAFTHYATACFAAFGDRVKEWITINEPWVVAVLGHGMGIHAPGRRDVAEAYEAGHVLLLAHAAAVAAYRADYQRRQGGRIAITLDGDWAYPRGGGADADGVAAASIYMDFRVGWFAHPIWGARGEYPPIMRATLGDRLPTFTRDEAAALCNSSDFYGMNHYRASLLATTPGRRSAAERVAAVASEAVTPNATAVAEAAAAAAAAVAAPDGGDPWGADAGVVEAVDPSWGETDLGWAIAPDGFAQLLLYVSRTYTPVGGIIVTENGMAAPNETTSAQATDPTGPGSAARIAFYDGYLRAMHGAIAAGADVRGYFLWSAMDNFEWAFGYGKRFGLLWVDFDHPSRRRSRKPAFAWFRRVATSNTIEGQS